MEAKEDLRAPVLEGAIWRPSLLKGGLLLFGSILLILASGAFLALLLLTNPVSLLSFFLGLGIISFFALLILHAYWLYGLVSLRYTLGEDALTISWMKQREVIPLASVVAVVPGDSLRLLARPIHWPGYHVAHLPLDLEDKQRGLLPENLKATAFYATSLNLRAMVLVATTSRYYVLTPQDRNGFLNKIRAALVRTGRKASSAAVHPLTIRPSFYGLPFWTDQVVLIILGIAVLLNAFLFAYVTFKYPTLPPLLPLHYNSLGEVDIIGRRVEVFRMPAIGAAVLLADALLGLLLHAKERLAAYLLLSTAVLVQLLFAVAIVTIVY
ncbi:MAG: PH domain-containing protein [Chloroflexi bacterium]|nr:PH domain-containing protein [Chloroflexota bacterium]MCL5075942.1 PH domain-containing protein [Chloroflexota bacterium]